MIKKILLGTALVVIVGGLVFGAVNRTLAKNENESTALASYGRNSEASQVNISTVDGLITHSQGNGAYGGRGGQGAANANTEQVGVAAGTDLELSAEEIEALLYMREEEKLAHDVYVALYERWGLPIFQNISQSEQSHTDSIKTLLDRYGLADPASAEMGVFTNPELQALYNDLVAGGEGSLAEALKTGAAIEEIDILDLEKDLAIVTHTDIQQVFQNLLRGSESHLRAFVSNLSSQTGEIYQPHFMSAEQYQTIISTSSGNGNARAMGSAGGQGGRRGGQP
jgi:hypothetical protein